METQIGNLADLQCMEMLSTVAADIHKDAYSSLTAGHKCIAFMELCVVMINSVFIHYTPFTLFAEMKLFGLQWAQGKAANPNMGLMHNPVFWTVNKRIYNSGKLNLPTMYMFTWPFLG